LPAPHFWIARSSAVGHCETCWAVGNERGGQTVAILSSMASTCRRHSIDPQHYLTQLLTNLPAAPTSQIDQWLPDRWKNTQVAREK
jgi:transposase